MLSSLPLLIVATQLEDHCRSFFSLKLLIHFGAQTAKFSVGQLNTDSTRANNQGATGAPLTKRERTLLHYYRTELHHKD